jgi:hypothetical protein
MSAHQENTEHDITPKANLMIWGGFLLFGLGLYMTITVLTIYFKAEAEREYYVKVGSVKSKELIELRQQEQEELKGIEQAMEKVVRVAN